MVRYCHEVFDDVYILTVVFIRSYFNVSIRRNLGFTERVSKQTRD